MSRNPFSAQFPCHNWRFNAASMATRHPGVSCGVCAPWRLANIAVLLACLAFGNGIWLPCATLCVQRAAPLPRCCRPSTSRL